MGTYAGNVVNLLFSLQIPAGGMRVIRIQTEGGGKKFSKSAMVTEDALSVGDGVVLGSSTLTFAPGFELPYLP